MVEYKRAEGKDYHDIKEGLFVWMEDITIHYEGHVNLMIWVYSGYPDTCKDHKEGQR